MEPVASNRPHAAVRRTVFSRSLALVALAVGRLTAGETAGVPAADASGGDQRQMQAQLSAMLAALALPVWQHSATLETELGYRDNLTLTPFTPTGRAFFRTDVEALTLRLPTSAWEAFAFLDGEVTRYFSPPPQIAGEQQWFAHAEARWKPTNRWRVAGALQGYYQDEVIDLSSTEAVRVVAPMKVLGGIGTLTGRADLPAGWAVEAVGSVHRSDFRQSDADFVEPKAGLRLEWNHGGRWAVAATAFERKRRYDSREEYTAFGRALTGTRLCFRQREAEISAKYAWTAHGKWTAKLGAGLLTSRDGASGFFDYDQRRGQGEITWEATPWTLAVEGSASRYRYLVQTVGIGLDPPLRRRDENAAKFRVSRTVAKGWIVFGEYRWERSDTNEDNEDYRVLTAGAGLRREF
jgi:hypothetical protein